MALKSNAFKDTYLHYLSQIKGLDLWNVSERLGLEMSGNDVLVPLLGDSIKVSGTSISGPSGDTPTLERCVVVSKYLLMAPDFKGEATKWVSYKDLKDSGPLTVFWTNDVEKKVEDTFSGRADELANAINLFHGCQPKSDYPYDIALKVYPLPKIPFLLLFNDRDAEFPATCTLLIKKNADNYLDAESLAILGALFAARLIGNTFGSTFS